MHPWSRRFLYLLWFAALPVSATPLCDHPIYLTFDVGDMRAARQIAKVLDEEHVKATFFLANKPTFRGDHVLDKSWQDFWRARVADGDSFGDHTWHHYYARQDLPDGRLRLVDFHGRVHIMNEAQYCHELTRVDQAFYGLTGKHLAGIWRAPGGRTTQRSIRWAAACGYPVHVGWTRAGLLGDELPSGKYPNAMLLHRALRDLKPGDVTLMHLGIHSRHDPLAKILQPLIRGLKARGMCFATIGG
jgi:peptidoglycan/xylan/chitin deacetylase (PgdA/CDA1 family)